MGFNSEFKGLNDKPGLLIMHIYSYATWEKHATDPPVNAEWSFKVSALLSTVSLTHKYRR